jgi:hypothetical protein
VTVVPFTTTTEPGRGRECAEYLLVHLRDELPTAIRARIIDAEERDPLYEGRHVPDEFAEVRRQIIQPTPDEEDALTEARLKERIGLGEILSRKGLVPTLRDEGGDQSVDMGVAATPSR